MMDILFSQVDKYSILEDDVQEAFQQVLVTNHPTKNDKAGSSKSSNQSRQCNKRQMDYSPSVIENPGRLLSGFNEATTTSLCDDVLSV
ncbi:hypothetical protein CK203_069097 [Vitis vinifera]|uniref:Uncharacterized protein n=1 Tax=Vitis vinifera TaxID=29760 RepID=A0A438F1Y8_VITVI|nr:hypothetical protein CK203_069097 [Vitis vinifera]